MRTVRARAGRLGAIVLVAVAVTGHGAVDSADAAKGKRSSSLVDFRDCNNLGNYLRGHSEGYGGATGGIVVPGLPEYEPGGGGEAPPAAAPSTPESGAPVSETGTNVQEAGIDEPDFVKSARSALLVLADGDLHALVTPASGPRVAGVLDMTPETPPQDGPPGGAEPGAPAIAPPISYPAGPSTLLVHRDRALVIGSSYDENGASTTLTEVDVSNPAALQVTRTIELEGSFVSARQSGSIARFVVAAYPDFEALEQEGAAPEAWLPELTVTKRGPGRSEPLSRCRQIDRTKRYTGSGMQTMLTVEIDGGARVIDSDSVLTESGTVYASEDRMYVATERWSGEEQFDDPVSDVSTQIHAFSTTERDQTHYAGSGKVPGWMLSQFSMSERKGYLRVATTTVPPWMEGSGSAESQSFITVLAERDGRLVQAGQVGGLGEGEEIYAVRFLDEVGYVVTFRQTDPLYTIDLSDPEKPRVTGELKIPGYSAYLHPLSGDRLLGVGQDADSSGRVRAAQLSLFDVSDPRAPRRIDTQALGPFSRSSVEYDHHAFFYDPATGVSIVPMSSNDFQGAVGTRIGRDGLTEIGRLEHGGDYRSQIQRSVKRGDRVYTVSNRGTMGHDPVTLEPLGFAAFP